MVLKASLMGRLISDRTLGDPRVSPNVMYSAVGTRKGHSEVRFTWNANVRNPSGTPSMSRHS